MKASFFYILLFLVVSFSCTQPPDYPTEPVIEFNSLNKTLVQAGVDEDLFLVINYTDGDGDLGAMNDSLDIYLNDLRVIDANVPITFKLPFVPVQGTGNGISGEITLKLPATGCIFPDNSPMGPIDTLVYEVYIIDRAGNESNRVLTDEIIVDCGG